MKSRKIFDFNNKFFGFLLSVFIFMIIIGFSYAYWRKTITQANPNTISTLSCLNVTITGTNTAINITDDYSITDAEGMARTPYTFTLANTCSTYVKATIRLEDLSTSTLSPTYLKVSLNNSGVSYNNSRLLSNYSTTNPNISGATAYIINSGVFLSPNSSKNFDLRAWIDENVTATEGMNKDFYGKISVSYEPKATYSTNGELFAWTHSGETTANGGMKLVNEVATTSLEKTTSFHYYGSNPNNYVTFNGELWRIIGVFETENNSGSLEYRLKLIRNSSIGSYSWDSSDSGVNTGKGINEWSQADLYSLLNSGLYYTRSSGSCYNGASNASTTCDFTSTGLSTTSRTQIALAKFYLGGLSSSTITTADSYLAERNSNVVTTPADGITRNTKYSSYVGLMYPSDYGYAALESKCLSSTKLDNYSSCSTNNWLFDGNDTTFLSPSTTTAYSIYYLNSTGNIATTDAQFASAIRPVVYLKPSINISSGAGTSSNPYILS